MYDSWSSFYNTGSTYSYLDYKKTQRKSREIKTSESSTNLKK